MQKIKFVLIVTTLLLPMLTGCGSSSVISTRVNSPMVMDGKTTDWGKALNYVEDEKIGFGVKDSEEALYLCFTTRDWKRAAHFLRTGITFFVDPGNDNCNYFGIRIKSNSPKIFNNRMRKNRSTQNVEPTKQTTPHKVLSDFVKKAEFKIVNIDDEIIDVFPLDNDFGIEQALSFDNSQFVCEIKIPLKQAPSTPYATCTAPGQTVQVGVISGVIDMDEMRKNRSGSSTKMGAGVGGRGGGRGGMGGRGGGKGGRGSMGSGGAQSPAAVEMPDPLKYWLDIKISE